MALRATSSLPTEKSCKCQRLYDDFFRWKDWNMSLGDVDSDQHVSCSSQGSTTTILPKLDLLRIHVTANEITSHVAQARLKDVPADIVELCHAPVKVSSVPKVKFMPLRTPANQLHWYKAEVEALLYITIRVQCCRWWKISFRWRARQHRKRRQLSVRTPTVGDATA